jgi:hypothetical protein
MKNTFFRSMMLMFASICIFAFTSCKKEIEYTYTNYQYWGETYAIPQQYINELDNDQDFVFQTGSNTGANDWADNIWNAVHTEWPDYGDNTWKQILEVTIDSVFFTGQDTVWFNYDPQHVKDTSNLIMCLGGQWTTIGDIAPYDGTPVVTKLRKGYTNDNMDINYQWKASIKMRSRPLD